MINKIKNNIKNNLGNEVKVFYNGSRNKKEEYCGIIKEVYDNIFIIALNESEIKCFSYFDVLTSTVEIKFDKI